MKQQRKANNEAKNKTTNNLSRNPPNQNYITMNKNTDNKTINDSKNLLVLKNGSTKVKLQSNKNSNIKKQTRVKSAERNTSTNQPTVIGNETREHK